MSLQIFLGYRANGSQFIIIETLRMENADTDFYTNTHTMCTNITTNIIYHHHYSVLI